jgi:hypothetical protein
MAKLTVHSAASAAAPVAALQEDKRPLSAALADGVEITDAKGRRLKLKRPTILQESRLMRMLGDAAESPAYLNAFVMPTVLVTAINGEDRFFPGTQGELDQAIQELDRDGLSAIIQYITRAAPENSTEESAAVKN